MHQTISIYDALNTTRPQNVEKSQDPQSSGMQSISAMSTEQDASVSGCNNFRQYVPRATFIVVTPKDRGKHHRGYISIINANSALLRHSCAPAPRVRIELSAGTGSQARRPRNRGSSTVVSGYVPDCRVSHSHVQESQISYDLSLSRSSSHSEVTRNSNLPVESGNRGDDCSKDNFFPSASYQYNIDKILQSTLDPFLRLPLNLSRHERGLLHFYLTDARTLIFGRSPRPVYDVAVYCASILIEHCSLYAVVKLASAESILCRATGKELSPAFFSLRARAYGMMNRMLNDPKTSFFVKVEGFNQLGIMEMFLNHTTMQKQHFQAMWHYIEAHGGCSRFISGGESRQGTLDIGVYSGNFVYIDLPVMSKTDLDAAICRFTSTLRNANLWYRHRESCSQHNQMLETTQFCTSKVVNLQIYLDWLIGECLKTQDSPRHLVAGAFHSIYNLFMTPVVSHYDSRDSRSFLLQVESCMQQRPTAQRQLREISELVSISHIFQGVNTMLFYVRSLLSGERQEAEVVLCQNSVDALKVLPLLSDSSILRLARDMIRYLLIPVNSQSHNPDNFDENYLQDLTWEIGKSWGAQNKEH